MVQCVSLLSEFEHVKQWAADNKMIINISKAKELVFQRPSLKHFLAPSALWYRASTQCKTTGSYL